MVQLKYNISAFSSCIIGYSDLTLKGLKIAGNRERNLERNVLNGPDRPANLPHSGTHARHLFMTDTGKKNVDVPTA